MDSRTMINPILATLLSALFLSLLPAQTYATNGVQVRTLIENVCKIPASGDYKSCLETLGHNPGISSVTDAKSLARIALEAVSNQSSNIQSFLGLTIKSHPEAAQPLGECVSELEDSKTKLVLIDEDIKRAFAGVDVSYALNDVERCEFALAQANVSVPELGVMITKWRSLFAPAYASVPFSFSRLGFEDCIWDREKKNHFGHVVL